MKLASNATPKLLYLKLHNKCLTFVTDNENHKPSTVNIDWYLKQQLEVVTKRRLARLPAATISGGRRSLRTRTREKGSQLPSNQNSERKQVGLRTRKDSWLPTAISLTVNLVSSRFCIQYHIPKGILYSRMVFTSK